MPACGECYRENMPVLDAAEVALLAAAERSSIATAKRLGQTPLFAEVPAFKLPGPVKAVAAVPRNVQAESQEAAAECSRFSVNIDGFSK